MGKCDYQDDVETIKIERTPEVTMAGKSIVGTRKYQQDAFDTVRTDWGCLAVICDGMGGMEHGELASQMAVETLKKDFERLDGSVDIPDFMIKEAAIMDRAVAGLKEESGRMMDTGTTIVAVIIKDNALYWLSVGDSRIYIMRGDEMICVTRAHNYGYQLEQKLKKGEINRQQFEEEQSEAEALVSYLGMNGLELLDVNRTPFELEYGDRVLLCSDGLYKCLSEEQLKEMLLYSNYGAESTVQGLMDAVEDAPKKSKDNTTVILLSYE